MVLAQLVVALGGGDEITGNQRAALMHELIERMLTVGAWLTEDDRAGAVVDRMTLQIHGLAVAFHVALLQIVRQILEMLVIGQDGVGVGGEEVVVPDAEQRHDHRDIPVEGRGAEMLVDAMGALQHGLEAVHANGQGNRQADGGPDRVAAADPIPELEHIVRVNTEFRDLFRIGGDRHEMLGHGARILHHIQ